MIPNIFIAIGVAILSIWNLTMSVFQLPYINQLTNSISWAIGLIAMSNGIFPTGVLCICLGIILMVKIFKYQIKFIFETLWPMVPFIGKPIHLPRMDDQTNGRGSMTDIRTDQSYRLDLRARQRSHKKNQIDLRK